MTFGVNAPNGLARVLSGDSATDNAALTYFLINPATTVSIYNNDPVMSAGDGTITKWVANSGQPIVGVFQGVEWLANSPQPQRYQTSKCWIAGTPTFQEQSPKAMVDCSVTSRYSVQVSISNAQLSYWDPSRIAGNGPLSRISNPTLGLTAADTFKIGNLALGGDSFSTQVIPPAGATAIPGANTYFYNSSYAPVPSVSNQPVVDNPTDGNPLTGQSAYYLDRNSLHNDYATGAATVLPQGYADPNSSSTPDMMGAVQVIGLDTTVNNNYTTASTTTGTGPNFTTTVANNSFNNAVVRLNIHAFGGAQGTLPRFTAHGRISAPQFDQWGVLAAPPVLPLQIADVLPILDIRQLSNKTLMIHSIEVTYVPLTGAFTTGFDLVPILLSFGTGSPISQTQAISAMALLGNTSTISTPANSFGPILTKADMQIVPATSAGTTQSVYRFANPTAYNSINFTTANYVSYEVGADTNLPPCAPWNALVFMWNEGSPSATGAQPQGYISWRISYSVLPTQF